MNYDYNNEYDVASCTTDDNDSMPIDTIQKFVSF